MAVNADKPDRWKKDIAQSVDLYNNWFLRFAPNAYRETRQKTAAKVESALKRTRNLRGRVAQRTARASGGPSDASDDNSTADRP